MVDAEVLKRLGGAIARPSRVSRRGRTTWRELVAQGCSNREIAEQLFISEGTVRNALSVVLDKLELRDRTQLANTVLEKEPVAVLGAGISGGMDSSARDGLRGWAD